MRGREGSAAVAVESRANEASKSVRIAASLGVVVIMPGIMGVVRGWE